MATECVTEMPQPHVVVRPRKRQRCGWDVPAVPTISEALIEVSCAQKVGEVTSLLSLRTSPFHFCPTLNKKEVIQNGSPPRHEDDKDGHFMFSIGESLTPRYLIHSKMGEGTFGKVLQCWDRERNEMVAIKVIRGLDKYHEAAMIEIQVLEHLAKHETTGTRRHAEKYVRHGRLDWPEGATSRESIKAVQKLPHLYDIIYDHISDHSADDFIDLLQGLLKFDPTKRLTAKSALRHPFFTLDHNHQYHLHHNCDGRRY